MAGIAETRIAKNGVVETWFGDDFYTLDPLIQRLHQQDHTLQGDVEIEYASGLAGTLGKSISKKLGIPTDTGRTLLTVGIHHASDSFHWSRQFEGGIKPMASIFYPVGKYPHGGWRENTDGVDITLGVEIKESAWHWTQKSVSVRGFPAPRFTSPKVIAYKKVVDGKYYFYVEFKLPGIGTLFKYNGLLSVV